MALFLFFQRRIFISRSPTTQSRQVRQAPHADSERVQPRQRHFVFAALRPGHAGTQWWGAHLYDARMGRLWGDRFKKNNFGKFK